MIGAPAPKASGAIWRTGRIWPRLTFACAVAGVLLRLSFLTWQDPWGPHHPDEGILPLESIALWEGITPREVGWPASTTRLLLSFPAAGVWAVQSGPGAWQHRASPERALQAVTDWIGRQYLDRQLLYFIGRFVSLAVGILQLLAALWALRRWVPEPGVFAGMVIVALGVLPVMYSQYVLADMTGALVATLIAGLAARPASLSIWAMAALAGAAAASKFHFGVWLLAPLACIWLSPGRAGARWRATGAALALAAGVDLALVPWLWTNPVLGLKEFAGVVLVKVAAGADATAAPLAQLVGLAAALGVAAIVGGLLGLIALRRDDLRRWLPVLVPTGAATIAMAASDIVFDRYALVLLPGVALLAGLGWQRLVMATGTRIRRLSAALLAVTVLWSLADTLAAVGEERDVDVDVAASRWVLAHVPRGRSVAVYDETVAPLPRSTEALQRCLQRVEAPRAYEDKWAAVGRDIPSTDAEPMRSAVLNDEHFFAYWCRRELDVQADPGYDVVLYHDGQRFWAVPQQQAFADFREGRLDVLIANGQVEVGRPPAAIVRSGRSVRAIYVQPDTER